MHKKVFFLFCFISFVFLSKAQEKKVLWYLGISPIYGKVWAHTKALSTFGGSGFKGVQLDFNRTRTDQAAFDYAQTHYSSGISLQIYSFDAPELGSTINAIYFIEPCLVYKPNFQLKLRGGGGLNYATNPWNGSSNPINYAYSRHTSGCLVLGLMARYQLNYFSAINANILYNHFSNGNTQNPNLGLNYPQVGIGYEVLLNQRTRKIQKNQNSFQKYYAEVYGLISNKSHPDTKTTRYPLYGMGVSFGKRLSNLHALTLGAEVFTDKSMRYSMDNHPIHKYGNYSDVLGGVSVGHDFVFHQMRFTQQIGYFFFREAPDYFIGPIFQRYGVDFTFHKRFTLGLNLNADLKKAIEIDLRVGWRFFGKQ
jgi:hypothetical protein